MLKGGGGSKLIFLIFRSVIAITQPFLMDFQKLSIYGFYGMRSNLKWNIFLKLHYTHTITLSPLSWNTYTMNNKESESNDLNMDMVMVNR